MTYPTSNQRDFATGPEFEPMPYGLLDSASVVSFTGHQKLGVMYQVDSCTTPLEYSTVCTTGLGPEKDPTTSVLWRASDPFLVYSWLPCTYAGGEPPEKLRADTLAAHQNNAARQVEEIFWTGGDFATSQRLSADTEVVITADASGLGTEVVLQTAATDVTPTPGTKVGVTEALALLEQNMADCYGGTPWIHVPRGLVAIMAAAHLLDDDLDSRGRLRTKAGSIVVAYAGDNTGPDGTEAAAGEAWMYATGAVKVWRGALRWTARDAAEALYRPTNSTVLIVEERFIVGWDCCHFAVLADTTDPTA
jgi:hypothetical protein